MAPPVLSDSTALPRVTIGFASALTLAVFGVSVFYNDMAEVSSRQRRYIERRDQQHAEHEARMEEINERYDALCRALTLMLQEPVCE